MDLSALNLGMIASYYCISYTTIERFSSLLSSKTKTKGLLEILTSASEYDMIPIRPGEEERLQRLINHQRFSFENPNWTDPLVRSFYLQPDCFPNIDLSYEVVGGEEVTTGKEVTLQVMLERDMEGRTEVGAVDALRYPKKKEEGWWLVVGDTKTNQLVAIKRVSLQKKAKLKQERSHTHCT
ncbi:unnamed protein product [Brassica rapa subsp. narinosa]